MHANSTLESSVTKRSGLHWIVEVSVEGVWTREISLLASSGTCATAKALEQLDDHESVLAVRHLTFRDTPTHFSAPKGQFVPPIPRDLAPLYPDAELRHEIRTREICAPHWRTGGRELEVRIDE